MTKTTNDNQLLMFNALCVCLGYPKPLIRLWEKNEPRKFDALIEVSEMLSELQFPIGRLEMALDAWRGDWRAKNNQAPTIQQFGELAAMTFAKWQQQEQTLQSLNKEQAWYIQQGMTKNELDDLLWTIENERDQRWGSYCT